MSAFAANTAQAAVATPAASAASAVPAAPVLELRDISFGYEDGTPALQGVSAAIHPGERIAVLGNNGAGKSTFFLCCNGVLTPKCGGILLEGKALGRKKRELMRLRQAVGLVFQDPDDQILAPTVAAEVSFGPLNLGLDDGEVTKRVDTALADMDLAALRERPPHYVSGGEKKRVTIADILAMRPRVLLFDEPTSSLDPQNTARLEGTLETLRQKGMALLVATHDIDFAWRWAQRVLVFHAGRLLADDTPLAVFGNDVLLQRAGLQKPTLYAVAEALCVAKGAALPQHLPRAARDIPTFIKENGL